MAVRITNSNAFLTSPIKYNSFFLFFLEIVEIVFYFIYGLSIKKKQTKQDCILNRIKSVMALKVFLIFKKLKFLSCKNVYNAPILFFIFLFSFLDLEFFN